MHAFANCMPVKSNTYPNIYSHIKMSQLHRQKNDRHHDDDDVPSSENQPNVELATLTLPLHHLGDGDSDGSNKPRKAVTLHASKDTTSAFATDAERPPPSKKEEVGPGVTGTVSSPCVQTSRRWSISRS